MMITRIEHIALPLKAWHPPERYSRTGGVSALNTKNTCHSCFSGSLRSENKGPDFQVVGQVTRRVIRAVTYKHSATRPLASFEIFYHVHRDL
jgi:hypothetical protein